MIVLKRLHIDILGDPLCNYLVSKGKISDQCVVKCSRYFDEKYYLAEHTQAVDSSVDPLTHYMKHGTNAESNPSKEFDATFYNIANPECLRSNINPIVHYISKGRSYGALKCSALDKPSVLKDHVNKISKYFPASKVNTSENLKYVEGKSRIVAFFTHNLNLEGATLVCRDIVLGVKKIGTFVPIVFSPLDGVLREDYEKMGIKVVIYPEFDKYNISSLAEYKKHIIKVSKVVKEFEIDIIYGNTILSFWIVHLANYLCKPSILHIHESEPINYHVCGKNFDFAPLIVHALKLSFRVVFVSDSTREKYRQYNKNNNHIVVKNSLDAGQIPSSYISSELLRNELNIANNELMFINVGTVTNRKGQLDIVNVLHHLSEEVLALVHFVFIGDVDTQYSQYLHKTVDALPENLSEKIHFVKKTANVFDYYNAADAFVFTSRIESYPKVIQEAMYFRLSIISTPVDGIVEQLQDGVSGLFYSPGDTIALSNLIKIISRDDGYRQRLGSQAFSALESMISSDEMIKNYSQLLTEASCV